MRNLNENETIALNAIIDTCDEIENDLFTRLSDAMLALVDAFKDGKTAGGYFTDLQAKGYLELEEDAYGVGVWVNA